MSKYPGSPVKQPAAASLAAQTGAERGVTARKGARSPRPSRNKYGAKRTELDGITLDSRKEAKRYAELKILERAGEITDLAVHPEFNLMVNGTKVGRIKMDFTYVMLPSGHRMVEEVKSSGTRKERSYRFRMKVFKACFPDINVAELVL